MPRIRVRQVDAFTRTPHTGNPAGVVLDAKDLSDQQMQSIAREMNLSETAFILPPNTPNADMRIRWFTPKTEVPLCGHATIASFHALAEEGMVGMKNEGDYRFDLETEGGILPIDVKKNGSGISIMMGMKIPSFERVMQYKLDLVRILKVAFEDLEIRLSIMRSDYIFVGVRRLHTLFSMRPDLTAMENFLSARKIRGLCVYTAETVDRDSHVHSRFFAPHLGISEDPVTGASHSSLAVLLHRNGLLEMRENRCVFQGEQGDVLGRRGRVKVELVLENNKPACVRIGGDAVTVLEGELLLPD